MTVWGLVARPSQLDPSHPLTVILLSTLLGTKAVRSGPRRFRGVDRHIRGNPLISVCSG